MGFKPVVTGNVVVTGGAVVVGIFFWPEFVVANKSVCS